MPNMGELRRAIDLLAANFDLVDLQPDGSVRLASLDGAEVVLRVVSATLPTPGHPGEVPHDLFATRPEWDLATLQRRGLPPEWSREWLVETLALSGTLYAAARRTGRPEAALEEFRQLHGIENAREEYARAAWASGRWRRQSDLAAHMGISGGVLSRYIGKANMNGKRADENEVVREVVEDELREHHALPPYDFNRRVRARLRDLGDRRTDSKLTHLITRFRRELSGD